MGYSFRFISDAFFVDHANVSPQSDMASSKTLQGSNSYLFVDRSWNEVLPVRVIDRWANHISGARNRRFPLVIMGMPSFLLSFLWRAFQIHGIFVESFLLFMLPGFWISIAAQILCILNNVTLAICLLLSKFIWWPVFWLCWNIAKVCLFFIASWRFSILAEICLFVWPVYCFSQFRQWTHYTSWFSTLILSSKSSGLRRSNTEPYTVVRYSLVINSLSSWFKFDKRFRPPHLNRYPRFLHSQRLSTMRSGYTYQY